jgi:hypothetical protein
MPTTSTFAPRSSIHGFPEISYNLYEPNDPSTLPRTSSNGTSVSTEIMLDNKGCTSAFVSWTPAPWRPLFSLYQSRLSASGRYCEGLSPTAWWVLSLPPRKGRREKDITRHAVEPEIPDQAQVRHSHPPNTGQEKLENQVKRPT